MVRDDDPRLTRARAGDEEAFDSLARDLLPNWIMTAFRILGDRTAAEDAAFLVLEKFWSIVMIEKRPVDHMVAFTRKMARNQALDSVKSRSRRQSHETQAGEETEAIARDPAETVLESRGFDTILQELGGLDETIRLVVHLRVVDRLGFREIGQRIPGSNGGTQSEEWAKKTFQRAIQRLKSRADGLYSMERERTE